MECGSHNAGACEVHRYAHFRRIAIRHTSKVFADPSLRTITLDSCSLAESFAL
jgi:hypothetical protein